MKVLNKNRVVLSLMFVGVLANMQILTRAPGQTPRKFTITNNTGPLNVGRKLHLSVDTTYCGSPSYNNGTALKPINDLSMSNLTNDPKDAPNSVSFSLEPSCGKINVIVWDDSNPGHVYSSLGNGISSGGTTTWPIEWNGNTITSSPKSTE